MPGLWLSGLLFFAVNCWILGIIVSDHEQEKQELDRTLEKEREKLEVAYPREMTLKDEGVESIGEGEYEGEDDNDVEEIPRAKTVEVCCMD